MRHRKSGRKLGRNSSHRKAMFRNMATSLLEHGQDVRPKPSLIRRHAFRRMLDLRQASNRPVVRDQSFLADWIFGFRDTGRDTIKKTFRRG